MFSKIAIVLVLATALETTWSQSTFDQSVTDSTQNLFGINCIADAVYNLEDAAGEFLYKIQSCGQDAVSSALVVSADISDLSTTTNILINTNDNTCNNAAYADEDARRLPSGDCVSNIRTMMDRLHKNTKQTVLDIDAITNINACGKMALTTYKLAVQNFDSFITVCGNVAKTQ